MPQPQVAPYGSWKSPITSDLIVAGTIGLGEVRLDGDDLYWLELRPSEGGRSVIVRRSADGSIGDITPPPFNVRTRVHEYGGGAYTVENGTLYFIHFADQRLYCQPSGQAPSPLTPAAAFRYADGVLAPDRKSAIYVREDHTAGEQDAINTLVRLNFDNPEELQSGGVVLTSGHDFYASPRISPDGRFLSWITWDHPNMPWDGTELWVAELLPDGSLGQTQKVAGGLEEAIFQPEWSPAGVLYFVSDRTGWWNLYRWHQGEVQPLCEKAAEFGEPHWVFGMSTYGFIDADRIFCRYSEPAGQQLAILHTQTGQLEAITTPYTSISQVQVQGNQAAFLGGSPTLASAVVLLDLTTRHLTVIRQSSDLEVDPGYLSIPQAIEFPTENGLTAYGFFYPPQNQDYQAPTGERPPLLVKSHGGPTAATSTTLNLRIQYWTSRGFGVLDVNYGGSTGYGRAYRERLKGQWGIVDVDDCANGALYLAQQGQADGDRLVIDGGSAGGYTTLCALTFRQVFKAGASFYGVSDLEALARDTHKFEARYLDSLIGPYPERLDLYQQRSPIYAAEQLSCPVIFFQGLEDKVVPPNQAEQMVEVLRRKGLPVAYVAFEGEQHGFRRAENIKRTLDGELYFYARIFGFELADPVAPVPIENL